MQQSSDAADNILNAAERLFAIKGYDGVSVRLVAEQACVSKASVFHHFGSKELLYEAVLKRASAEFEALLGRLGGNSGSLRYRLSTFVKEHLACIYDKPSLSHLLLREVLEPGSDVSYTKAAGVLGSSFAKLTAVLRDEKQAQTIKPETDPALLAYLLIAANVFFFQSQKFIQHMSEIDFAGDSSRYTEAVVTYLLDGVLNHSDVPADH